MRLKALAAVRVRYGYRRLHVLLEREGWRINHKRVYRLYTEENLTMRTKSPKRRVSNKARLDRVEARAANDCWSMDFMSDELFNERRFRLLTIVDHFTRESLAIEVDHRFTGHDVVGVLARISAGRGVPQTIRVDNGKLCKPGIPGT